MRAWISCTSRDLGLGVPQRTFTALSLVLGASAWACSCRAVANLAVALLSLEESENRLLDLLARARNPLGKPLFDPKYALRLAKDRNR
jgi:hypothetical protein